MSDLIIQENAAIISALAAFISAFAAVLALIAVKNTNKIARAAITPVIELEYDPNSSEGVRIKNISDAYALNLKLQPTTIHFVDIDSISKFYIEDANLEPRHSTLIKVINKPAKKSKSIMHGDSFDLFYVIKESKKKEAGIIFQDITGHKNILKLRFIENNGNWKLLPKKVKSYRLYNSLADYLHQKYFIWLSWWRNLKYKMEMNKTSK